MRLHVAYWIGFFTSAFVIVAVAVGAWSVATEQALNFTSVAFGAIVALSISLSLILLLRRFLLKKILGATEASLSDIASDAIGAASSLSKGDHKEASDRAENAARSALGWYSWVNLYRWVINANIALLVAFAGFTGTVLLFEQNKRIQNQNEIIDRQREFEELGFLLADGQRRAARTTALNEALSKIAQISQNWWEIPQTQSEVSAAISTMQPYWFFDSANEGHYLSTGSSLLDGLPFKSIPDSKSRIVFASPERGLILQALVAKGIGITSNMFSTAAYGDKVLARPLMEYTDARGLQIGPAITASITQDNPVLTEPRDIFRCASETYLDERPRFPRITLDSDALEHSSFTNATLSFVTISPSKRQSYLGARVTESVIHLKEESQVRYLTDLSATYGVQFSVELKLLPRIASYLKFKAGFSSGGSVTPHSGNCAVVEIGAVSKERVAEVGNTPQDWVRHLREILSSELGMSPSEVEETFHFEVQNSHRISEDGSGYFGYISIFRKDFEIG